MRVTAFYMLLHHFSSHPWHTPTEAMQNYAIFLFPPTKIIKKLENFYNIIPTSTTLAYPSPPGGLTYSNISIIYISHPHTMYMIHHLTAHIAHPLRGLLYIVLPCLLGLHPSLTFCAGLICFSFLKIICLFM